jgi:sulfoxide reductase heme-binding subunit YedZ
MRYLKPGLLAVLCLPGLGLALDLGLDRLGARPLNELLHATGLWAVRLLLLSLAITPLRQVLQLPILVSLRRRIGVAAFAYAAIHLAIFVVDKAFDLRVVFGEIVLRLYLTIGFAALLMLAALAATSTDAMVRRLGKRWQALHRLAYVASVLAVVHHIMQARLNALEPTVMAGLLIWLLGYRLLRRRGRALAPPTLALLSLAAALLTAAGEALCYGLFTGIDPWLVLQANLAMAGERPAWIVLMITGAVCASALLRGYGYALRRSPA